MLGLDLDHAVDLPDWPDVLAHLRASGGPSVHDVLRRAADRGTPAVQPRCGVGGHAPMLALLRGLAAGAAPDVLSVTIDSHTRLKRFGVAADTLRRQPADLNGYPLVSHGWRRGRELAAAVDVPLEIRHGSPDPRELFAVAIAAGITSFEGGAISYNLPYSKNVPLADSLAAWQQVDLACGQLARDGVIVDRELFGTLTAVLVPPSVSLAISVLEALAAIRAGVRCVSIAYPQGGEAHQDIAALRAVPVLAARYLPGGADVFPVLHQFMGVFPADRDLADGLILYGGLVARLGRAAKIVTKTHQEAHGIPDAAANIAGMRTVRLAMSGYLDFLAIDEDRVAQEQGWLEDEVAELVEPVLDGGDLPAAIVGAFARGALDVPFSASIHAHSQVIPGRDPSGAVRYRAIGRLPFSAATRRRHERLLNQRASTTTGLVEQISRDINHLAERRAAGRRTPEPAADGAAPRRGAAMRP